MNTHNVFVEKLDKFNTLIERGICSFMQIVPYGDKLH